MNTDTIQALIEEIFTLRSNDINPVRLSFLENQLHQINRTNRNSVRIHTMATNFLRDSLTIRQMRAFLESPIIHSLITAPTQVGKTQAILDFIIECMNKKIAVIVSSDNKTDQQEQIFNRIHSGLMGMPFVLIKASDKKFMKKLKNAMDNGLIPITFCLDNFSQIQKTAVNYFQLTKQRYRGQIEKIVIIHDEGDVVTRSDETYNQSDLSAKSHEEWVEMIEDMKDSFQIKRMFVTATPENCVMKYSISSPYIIKLEQPNNYSSYKDIKYIARPNNQEGLKAIVQNTIDSNTVENDYSAVLYITDRRINNQAMFLQEFSELKGNFVVHTYNSTGITTTVPSNLFRTNLKNYSKKDIKFTGNYCNIKNMPIRDFYQIVKDSNINTAITIGMDLIARGISYCSREHTQDAMVATTMIYYPSKNLHNVAICQAIGRLTGTARPDLQRYLYAPVDVIENYINYNKNQEIYLKDLMSNDNHVSCERMADIQFENKLTRGIDRKKLGLKIKYAQDDTSVNYNVGYKSIIDKWLDENTIIAQIFRFIMNNEHGVSQTELLEFIETTKSTNNYQNYLEINKYKDIYTRSSNQITTLTGDAKNYIDTINTLH
jgi:hypothetical protein